MRTANDVKPDAMVSQRIAALPMYDFPELRWAHDALWAALADHMVAAGVTDVPRLLTRGLGHFEVWRHPQLLLGQGCEYPLAKSPVSVRVVATPRYAAPGCEGATYRSAIVVRAGEPAEGLAGLRKRRCAINEADSNSGMNLLRAALAPLAGSAPFFESVVLSGSHRSSVEMIASGQADLAAVDCVSFAHLQRLHPSTVAGLRILCWTPPSPSLPFITRSTSEPMVNTLRAALADVFADPALRFVRELLLLEGIDLEPDGHFTEVLRLERQAAELGFPIVR
jgi:ABC-type phosphate/phosphonate transport system substrate-binding protein